MTKQTKATLASYFETGSKPTQQQFADLIDSVLVPNSNSIVDVSAGYIQFANGYGIKDGDGSLIMEFNTNASVENHVKYRGGRANQNPQFTAVKGAGSTVAGLAFEADGNWFHAFHGNVSAPGWVRFYEDASLGTSLAVGIKGPVAGLLASTYDIVLPPNLPATGDFLICSAGGVTANSMTWTRTFPANVRFPTGLGIEDSNGNSQLTFTATTSAVNSWVMKNNSTGSGPILVPTGETNTAAIIASRGTGNVDFYTADGSYRQVSITNTVSPNSRLTLTGGTGQGAIGIATNASAANLALTPVGSGGFVKFGTFASDAAINTTGYIKIRTADGTVRRVAIVSGS